MAKERDRCDFSQITGTQLEGGVFLIYHPFNHGAWPDPIPPWKNFWLSPKSNQNHFAFS
jgi:hypothetical protein